MGRGSVATGRRSSAAGGGRVSCWAGGGGPGGSSTSVRIATSAASSALFPQVSIWAGAVGAGAGAFVGVIVHHGIVALATAKPTVNDTVTSQRRSIARSSSVRLLGCFGSLMVAFELIANANRITSNDLLVILIALVAPAVWAGGCLLTARYTGWKD